MGALQYFADGGPSLAPGQAGPPTPLDMINSMSALDNTPGKDVANATAGMAPAASAAAAAQPAAGTTSPLGAVADMAKLTTGHMEDIWKQGKERLSQYDALAPQRQAALDQYKQSLISQNKNPMEAFNQGWAYAMVSGRPGEAVASGMQMQTEQDNVNNQRLQQVAGTTYTDIGDQQKNALEVYKDLAGGAGSSAMMTAMIRATVGKNHPIKLANGMWGSFDPIAGVAVPVSLSENALLEADYKAGEKMAVDKLHNPTPESVAQFATNYMQTMQDIRGNNPVQAVNPDGTTKPMVPGKPADPNTPPPPAAPGVPPVAPGVPPVAPGVPPVAPPAKADKNAPFPIVAPAEQASRDVDRGKILADEYKTEDVAANAAFAKLSAVKAVGDAKAEQAARDELQLHVNNRNSIQKELDLFNKKKQAPVTAALSPDAAAGPLLPKPPGANAAIPPPAAASVLSPSGAPTPPGVTAPVSQQPMTIPGKGLTFENPGTKAAAEEMPKEWGTAMKEYNESSNGAVDSLKLYSQAADAFQKYKNAGGNTGIMQPAMNTMRKALMEVGLLSSDNVNMLSDADVIKKLNLQLGMAAGKSYNNSRATQQDLKWAMDNTPGIQMYEPATQQWLLNATAVAHAHQARLDNASEWRQRFPTSPPDQFISYWNLRSDYPEAIDSRFPPARIAAIAAQERVSPIEVIREIRDQMKKVKKNGP